MAGIVAAGGGVAFACYPVPAQAQVALTATAHSDYRLRGYPVSSGRPALDLAIAYDDASSGFYANGSVAGTCKGGRPSVVSGIANAGYAKRLGQGPVFDLGINHTEFTPQSVFEEAKRYTEAYVGLVGRNIASHIYFSPNYLSDAETFYVDLKAGTRLTPNLRITAKTGLLMRLDRPRYSYLRKFRHDVRIGAVRRVGPVDVQVAWTSSDDDYSYEADGRGGSGFVFSLSYTR